MARSRLQKKPVFGYQRQVRMGLGEAIGRLIKVEKMHQMGISDLPEKLIEERDLIVNALNQIELDLGFDCNNDGIPDTVEIFQQTVSTSCCRILPHKTGSSSGTVSTPPPKKRRRRGSSRRSKAG